MATSPTKLLEQFVVEDNQGDPNKDPSIHPARAYIDALKDFDGVLGGCFRKILCRLLGTISVLC